MFCCFNPPGILFVVMTWANSVAGQRLCWNALTCLRLSPHGPVRLPVTLFVVHIAFVFLVFSFHIAIGSLAGCEGVEAESCAAAWLLGMKSAWALVEVVRYSCPECLCRGFLYFTQSALGLELVCCNIRVTSTVSVLWLKPPTFGKRYFHRNFHLAAAQSTLPKRKVFFTFTDMFILLQQIVLQQDEHVCESKEYLRPLCCWWGDWRCLNRSSLQGGWWTLTLSTWAW